MAKMSHDYQKVDIMTYYADNKGVHVEWICSSVWQQIILWNNYTQQHSLGFNCDFLNNSFLNLPPFSPVWVIYSNIWAYIYIYLYIHIYIYVFCHALTNNIGTKLGHFQENLSWNSLTIWVYCYCIVTVNLSDFSVPNRMSVNSHFNVISLNKLVSLLKYLCCLTNLPMFRKTRWHEH